MRWMLGVAPALFACTTFDKHVVDHEPAAGFCDQLPAVFVAKYDDGSPLLGVKPVEGHPGANEAVYFDRTGTPVLVERTVNNSALFFAVYYPNGQKRLAGAFKIEDERYIPQNQWEMYEEDGTPDNRDLPDDFFDYQPLLIDGRGPDNYPTPHLYQGISDNSCLLVCADAAGKLTGAFPIVKNSDAFDAAMERTYRIWQFTPRKIGDVHVPACGRVHFAIRP